MPKTDTVLVLSSPLHGGGLWLRAKHELRINGATPDELAQFDADCKTAATVRDAVNEWLTVEEPFRTAAKK